MHEKILLNENGTIQEYIERQNISSNEIEDFQKRITKNLDEWVDNFIGSIEPIKLEIDVSEFRSKFFPKIEASIFLSHSHMDEENILKLAILLERKNVKVFVDSVYWGYVGELQRKLDDKFAFIQESNTYDYKIRNSNAQNLYLTLSDCLTSMIDTCELFLFYKTQNSLPVQNLSAEATYSPWIMHELETVAKIRTQQSNFKKVFVQDSAPTLTTESYNAQIPPKYIHHVQLNNLKEISEEQFIECLKYNATNEESWFLNFYDVMKKSCNNEMAVYG